jgi:Helix-turn-helix of DDE superfamily endonuclease/DDE superfamily endonuclease
VAKPLVVEAIDQIHTQYQGLRLLFYRAALPLSRKTLTFASGIIRRHRKAIGSRRRKLDPGRQALLVLAYLRKGETFAELAAGFGVGTATAWRYAEETVALLAARAPELRQAVRDAKKAGWAYVVLDGTLILVDRRAADRPFYSGKHKRHGMNLQVIASPHGDVLWVSGALPGSVHDKKAEWMRCFTDPPLHRVQQVFRGPLARGTLPPATACPVCARVPCGALT